MTPRLNFVHYQRDCRWIVILEETPLIMRDAQISGLRREHASRGGYLIPSPYASSGPVLQYVRDDHQPFGAFRGQGGWCLSTIYSSLRGFGDYKPIPKSDAEAILAKACRRTA
jgi:hypothetical protein